MVGETILSASGKDRSNRQSKEEKHHQPGPPVQIPARETKVDPAVGRLAGVIAVIEAIGAIGVIMVIGANGATVVIDAIGVRLQGIRGEKVVRPRIDRNRIGRDGKHLWNCRLNRPAR